MRRQRTTVSPSRSKNWNVALPSGPLNDQVISQTGSATVIRATRSEAHQNLIRPVSEYRSQPVLKSATRDLNLDRCSGRNFIRSLRNGGCFRTSYVQAIEKSRELLHAVIGRHIVPRDLLVDHTFACLPFLGPELGLICWDRERGSQLDHAVRALGYLHLSTGRVQVVFLPQCGREGDGAS